MSSAVVSLAVPALPGQDGGVHAASSRAGAAGDGTKTVLALPPQHPEDMDMNEGRG